MESTATTAVAGGLPASASRQSVQALGSDDFFQLLIAQLTNQDPLEPTSNEELLQQVSSIREIELSTSLTRSLKTLTDQQRFGSASSLIGRYVSGAPQTGSTEPPPRGVVVGIRFGTDGQAILQLDSGAELPLEQLDAVLSARQAAEALIGQIVTGYDQTDPQNPRSVQGQAVAVREDTPGEIEIELDTGDRLKLGEVMLADLPAANAA